jgi:hypothetical protein
MLFISLNRQFHAGMTTFAVKKVYPEIGILTLNPAYLFKRKKYWEVLKLEEFPQNAVHAGGQPGGRKPGRQG